MPAAILARPAVQTPETPIDAHREHAMRHAFKRLRERYGRQYGKADIHAHAEAIRAGHGRVVSITESSTVYVVETGERTFIVAWSRHLGCIVTYLLASDPRYAGGRKARLV